MTDTQPQQIPAKDAAGVTGERSRGFGRGGARGGPRGGPRDGAKKGGFRGNDEVWRPVTKLGRLVKSGKIASIEDVFKFAVPIKEHDIVDFFLKDTLKEEVMQVKPVQKQTQAGQRTRFKAYVIVGDSNGHIGLGWKCSKEV
jgi:small subunit ribosomal protein S2e